MCLFIKNNTLRNTTCTSGSIYNDYIIIYGIIIYIINYSIDWEIIVRIIRIIAFRYFHIVPMCPSR